MLIPLFFVVSAVLVYAWPQDSPPSIGIPSRAPQGAGVPLESFVSFSIEFSYFPDYAGNLSNPNTFSNNLLDNIAVYSGSKPYIRVGGSSQDNAIFNESQKLGTILNFATPTSDQPANLTFGPAFFESYQTWPKTTFTHGFNIKANSTAAHEAQLASVQYACNTLRGKLLAWELGNEPDLLGWGLYGPPARGASYNEAAYVSEWLNITRAIRGRMQTVCPDLATSQQFQLYAPSFADAVNISTLDPVLAWEAGLNTDHDLKAFTAHHYQGVATDPTTTLAGTLMNHTATVNSVNFILNVSRLLHDLPTYALDLPFIMGEGNSLASQGRPGLSNTFGAALWGVDANLLMAANNIQRFHMHQGTNYRYQSWQPIDTNRTSIGTKAPYYGNIAVAAFLGDLTLPANRPQVVNVLLSDSVYQSAYASYVHGDLAKIMLLNLKDYNTTADNNYTANPLPERGRQTFALHIPRSCSGKTAALQRLIANGSDAVSGVTFDGYSYNYELDNGKPVLLSNVTRGETLRVDRRGVLEIEVPDSSAVLVGFK